MPDTAAGWIRALELEPHPEGGYFRELYRGAGEIPPSALPDRYGGARSTATSIFFLLDGDQASHWHRLKSDELWFYHAGGSLTVHMIDNDGAYSSQTLGPDPDEDQALQVIIPNGVWFGATVDDPASYCLMGCVVAPGFDYVDFELAKPGDLSAVDATYREIVERLTL